MAHIRPFRGLLYNPDKVAGDDVIAPPYDVISPEHKEALYRKSPYNVVRVDFGKELPGDTRCSNKYSRARDLLSRWEQEDVLLRDRRPAFYAYEADYTIRGRAKRLRGVLALVQLTELGKGVYPHEATHAKPKADRLALMRWCRANVSPIYALYNSAEQGISRVLHTAASASPYISARDTGGAEHRLYRIDDPAKIELITGELYDKPIFIADGHHRYEVALEYQKEMERSGEDADGFRPWDYVLMFLANMSDDGVSVLPTHRLFKGLFRASAVQERLETDFVLSTAPLDADITEVLAEAARDGGRVLGLYLAGEGQFCILRHRQNGETRDIPPALRDLDVVLLHELILKRSQGTAEVAFEMDVQEALRKVRAGDFEGVFFLNPTRVGDVERVALAQLRMPPKSTYFYPKLLTGMVIHSF